MTTELYKDLSCKGWILVSKSSYKSIFEKFQIKDIEKTTWKKAIKKSIKYYTDFATKAIKNGNFKKGLNNREEHSIIISEINKEWLIILSDFLNEKNSAYKSCSTLSSSKNRVYNFYMDYHTGYDRWIIFKNGYIQKICERNDNDELRITGQLNQQEENVLKIKGSYYDLTDIIKLYTPALENLTHEEINSKVAFYGMIQSDSIKTINRIQKTKEETRYLNPSTSPIHQLPNEVKKEKDFTSDDKLPF